MHFAHPSSFHLSAHTSRTYLSSKIDTPHSVSIYTPSNQREKPNTHKYPGRLYTQPTPTHSTTPTPIHHSTLSFPPPPPPPFTPKPAPASSYLISYLPIEATLSPLTMSQSKRSGL
ncbi:hypothetical protein CPC08DRAFT_712540 [Agrocybe pediades]|nr:hypothetical protein CPC08DRAFT_712540 [Agrocybe pediades]